MAHRMSHLSSCSSVQADMRMSVLADDHGGMQHACSRSALVSLGNLSR